MRPMASIWPAFMTRIASAMRTLEKRWEMRTAVLRHSIP